MEHFKTLATLIGKSLAFGLLLTGVAHAYVPPSQFIVKSMVGKHDGFKGMRIRSEVIALESNRPSDVKFKELTIYHSQTKTLKSWAMNEAGQELYEVERKGAALNLSNVILFENNVKNVSLALKDKDIPVKTEEELLQLPDEPARRAAEVNFLARWKGAPAWVIGKRGDDHPQLWIEKDTFLPIRLLYTPTGGSFVDVRYENYRFYKEFPYPRMITLVKGGEEGLLRSEVTEVVVNPDQAELKAAAARTVSGFTDLGNSAPTALRDLIRRYYEAIR